MSASGWASEDDDAANGQSANFTRSLNSGLLFSYADATDVILMASTNAATGVARLIISRSKLFRSLRPQSPLLAGAITVGLRRRKRGE